LNNPELSTERLRLNGLTAGDAPAMFEYRSDSQVCEYQSFAPRSLTDVEAFIGRSHPQVFAHAGTWFQFAVRLRESGRMIGDVGIHFLADDTHDQVEIGFTIAPEFQGRGYGAEAVSRALDFLLVECHKHRVFASVDPRNETSVRLLERVGMRQEAHFRKSLWFKGEWVDDVVFAVLRSEWRSK
jgi:RimJ/RimL family protein N-acetyltransferase